MKQTPNEFLKALKNVTMTADEKAAARAALLAKLGVDPAFVVAPAKPIPSPSWMRVFATRKFQTICASLLVVASLGSGLVFGAEGALPGDILYSFKRNVNEAVARVVRVTSVETSADFESYLLVKRLTEAEKLESENRLSDEKVRVAVRDDVSRQKVRAEEAAVKLLATAPLNAEASFEGGDPRTMRSVARRSLKNGIKAGIVATSSLDVPSDGASTTPPAGTVAATLSLAATTTVSANDASTTAPVDPAPITPALEAVIEQHQDILRKLDIPKKEGPKEMGL